MRKLTIVFHDAGGGHRSAAGALKDVLVGQDNPWEVSFLNLQELLDSLDLVRSLTGLRIQEAYNQVLRRGWTRLTPALLATLQGTIRLYHSRIVELLRRHWATNPANLVLSVIPHFNRALAESLHRRYDAPPFVTLITDLADYPSHFWIERESQYIIAGTARAKHQALAMGHREDHVFETSGMVLKPQFYRQFHVDKQGERKNLGLDPDCPTGIVLFGGHGSTAMIDILERLNQADSVAQLILLCGHNLELANRLRALSTRRPKLVLGFTPDVEQYMAMADFFIGKPGPGSISEALQLRLPVIIECNAKTLPQERYNAEWVKENGFGIVVGSFDEIAANVEYLLKPFVLSEFRRRTRSYCNRALFEIPDILERCGLLSNLRRSALKERPYDLRENHALVVQNL